MATQILPSLNEVVKMIENAVSGISGDTTASIAELEQKITAVETKNTSQDTAISTAQTTANEAKTIALGRSRAISYADNSDANTAITAMSNTELRVGDNIYIGTVGVPDWYVAEVLSAKGGQTLPTSGTAFADSYSIGYYKLYQLETEKVDLTNYVQKSEAIKSITYSTTTKKITITLANNSTSTIDLSTLASLTEVDTKITAAKAEVKPTQGSLASNILTVKNAAGTTLFTADLSGLSIPNATASTAGKTKLYKSTDTVSNSESKVVALDDGAISGKVAALAFPTKTAFNTLNGTVNEHTSDINDIKNNTLTVRAEDGEYTTAASGGGYLVIEGL